MSIAEEMAKDFGVFDDLFRAYVREDPQHLALYCEGRRLTYGELDELVDRAAFALQRDGVAPQDVVSICALSSLEYVAVFFATLRVGATIAPLAPSSTPQQLVDMIADCAATHLFTDAYVSRHLEHSKEAIHARRVALDEGAFGEPFEQWLAPSGARPAPAAVQAEWAFNLIYSSGTTGTPKAIVQSNQMRWSHLRSLGTAGASRESTGIIATPLYSNTTLVFFLPLMASGRTCVMMPKFDARAFLELSETFAVQRTMLVPVQYRRILDVGDFESFDLSAYQLKFTTSAPFSAQLKAEVLDRWPGGLVEIYGMTEGGGACLLAAHEHRDKLHTVGRPMPGHDVKVIDEGGNVLGPGEIGELVGRSGAMMEGYLHQPEKSAEAEWRSAEGLRYIRTGDLGVIDEDGFVTLVGRKKDMIISGGFNIYPVDLEQALSAHPGVAEAAVIAKSSPVWGETPVAFVVLRDGERVTGEALRDFANASLGKTQRISEVHFVDSLPRSAIGKVLKRELQELLAAE